MDSISFRAIRAGRAFAAVMLLAGGFVVNSSAAQAGEGWQEHAIRVGDGNGGWVTRPASRQVLKAPGSDMTMPFGIVRMQSGELAILCSDEKRQKYTRPVIAFSRDEGTTWSDFQIIAETMERPMNLTDLGNGRLSFVTDRRFFSSDAGRTWTESAPHPLTSAGMTFNLEGNAWVDRHDDGTAKAILELGWHYEPGKKHPVDDATVVFRRSIDGGKTWIDEVTPPQWKYDVEHNGKIFRRGVSEGALVRAANGHLVAALRTDMPPHFFDGPNDDSLEGTAMSISKDDGKTWSDMQHLYSAGRHHANLQRLPSGAIVCTLVVRDDIRDGKLVGHRRGCDALVSHDHGESWNLDRRYELDSYDFLREDGYWVDGMSGHIGAAVLEDGSVISAYGHYIPGVAVLIKWKPDEAP